MRISQRLKSIRIRIVRGSRMRTTSSIRVHDVFAKTIMETNMKLKKTMVSVALAAVLFGCVKSPNMERVAAETKKGLEASWAGKGVTVTAVNLSPDGIDKYSGTVSVKGDGWEEDVKITVAYKDEQITWNVDKWAMTK